jgi:hypothetical protein
MTDGTATARAAAWLSCLADALAARDIGAAVALFPLCRAAAEGADGGDPDAGLWRAGRAGRGGGGLRNTQLN